MISENRWQRRYRRKRAADTDEWNGGSGSRRWDARASRTSAGWRKADPAQDTEREYPNADKGHRKLPEEPRGKREEVGKQIASLRNDLTVHASSSKGHITSTERLEKQVATLRRELAVLKSSIGKDAARTRAKQEATLTRILAKVGAKPSKTAKRSKK